jgi:drug/metabolite transporter (DMT)-like permease
VATIRPAPLAFPALLVGAACLAVGPLFVRTAGVTPIASAFWRMALASPVVILIAFLTRQPCPQRRTGWWVLVGSGVLFAADIAAWHLGIVRTTLGNAVLFGNVSSFFFAGYGFMLARAWPSRRFALAMIGAGVGVALLLGRSLELSADHFAGDLLCILAAIFYTGYLAIMDRARASVGAWPALAVATLAGTVALVPLLPAFGGALVPRDWSPVLALALLSQVVGQGFVIYAVGHLRPEVSGLGLLIQPVIAAALGWAMFGEAMGAVDAFGAVLVLGSLAVARS